MAFPNKPMKPMMRKPAGRVNPTATIFDNPMLAQDNDSTPAEGDEAGQIAQINQRLDDLEQRVKALEGPEQDEQGGSGTGMMGQ